MSSIRLARFATYLVALAIAGGSSGCAQPSAVAPGLTTPYSAVVLVNGQTYFGKLEGFNTPSPVLTDVYYVQTQVNQETKEIKNALVKRNTEWHAPDRMHLNAAQILFVEPVAEQSTVAKLIDELKKH